jgi:hypothetical protein
MGMKRPGADHVVGEARGAAKERLVLLTRR